MKLFKSKFSIIILKMAVCLGIASSVGHQTEAKIYQGKVLFVGCSTLRGEFDIEKMKVCYDSIQAHLQAKLGKRYSKQDAAQAIEELPAILHNFYWATWACYREAGNRTPKQCKTVIASAFNRLRNYQEYFPKRTSHWRGIGRIFAARGQYTDWWDQQCGNRKAYNGCSVKQMITHKPMWTTQPISNKKLAEKRDIAFISYRLYMESDNKHQNGVVAFQKSSRNFDNRKFVAMGNDGLHHTFRLKKLDDGRYDRMYWFSQTY